MTPGLDPQELARALDVLAAAGDLPPDHPDSIALQRATAALFKAAKKGRRRRARDEVLAADAAVIALTATGSPHRLDDETAGIPLVSSTAGATAGTLLRPMACYICKQRYVEVDAFYHQLCPRCAAENHAKRDARTDLTGRRALLTGGRAKIGMYIALRLLRDGAHTTITTRFPHDAVRRFSAMPDADDWLDRLVVVGIDLRDPAQVASLADEVAEAGPLDILVNNACQTVRRSPGATACSRRPRRAALPVGSRVPSCGSADVGRPPCGAVGGARPGPRGAPPPARRRGGCPGSARDHPAGAARGLGLLDRVRTGSAIDAGGLVPDLVDLNSWTADRPGRAAESRWRCATRSRRSSSSAGCARPEGLDGPASLRRQRLRRMEGFARGCHGRGPPPHEHKPRRP
jgi:hypothetical protein